MQLFIKYNKISLDSFAKDSKEFNAYHDKIDNFLALKIKNLTQKQKDELAACYMDYLSESGLEYFENAKKYLELDDKADILTVGTKFGIIVLYRYLKEGTGKCETKQSEGGIEKKMDNRVTISADGIVKFHLFPLN